MVMRYRFLRLAMGLFGAALAAVALNPPIPPASVDVPLAKQSGKETAVFAGGCFWGIQAVFDAAKGVSSAISLGLDLKFPADAAAFFAEVQKVADLELLCRVRDAIRSAQSVDDLRKLITAATGNGPA